MKKTTAFLVLIVIVFVGAGIWYANNRKNQNNSTSANAIIQASYICKGGKTMAVSFYKGEQKLVEPGQPPIPSGSVKLVLSDGRNFNLPQTISADGSRYANSDESFIFWSKGSGALVLENNIEKSYIGCIVTAKDPGGLSKVYLDDMVGFSIRYPSDYAIDALYKYQALGPNKDIAGVKFTIPPASTSGTNLSQDSYLSIETIPAANNCKANLFLSYENGPEINLLENGINYSIASSTDAGAGNRYEEVVYAASETNPCVAVRYFIHYGAIENYLPDIKEFDKRILLRQFDEIRRTLVINQ